MVHGTGSAVGYWRARNIIGGTDMKRVGIHEIARLAGVSIGTVDRALHGRNRISEETRQRILAIAKNMGYRPNLAARALSVGKPIARVGICIPREIHFFYDQIRQGILAEARRHEHLGVSFIYRPVDRLGVAEPARVRELLGAEIQGLILTPGDPSNVKPEIDEAEKRGIRVVCVATDAPESARSTVICIDPRLNGKVAGELMGRFVPARSKVAIVTGMLQTEDHRKKVQGFSDVFPEVCKGGEIVELLEGHEDEDETFVKCSKLLHRLEGLAGLYVNTANCLPVCRAVTASGLAGRVKLVATDLFKQMVPYFEKDTIVASIYQRPYVQGQRAVRLLIDHIFSGQPIPPSYYLNPGIVLRSNLRLFREIRQAEIDDSAAWVSESSHGLETYFERRFGPTN
jgi:LacI family transcriptional regulator, galactose operon repressor